jgi:hypothetical protein
MNNASPTTQRGIYLRADAIDRVLAPTQLRSLNLSKLQQATLLGMAYANFWRLVNNRGRATDRNVTDILLAADHIATKWDGERLGFDDLFEIRSAP